MCKEPESQPEPGEGNSIFLLLKRKWWPWQPYTLSFINNINRQMADWEKIYEMLKTDSEKNSDLEYAKNPWNLIRKDMKLHKKNVQSVKRKFIVEEARIMNWSQKAQVHCDQNNIDHFRHIRMSKLESCMLLFTSQMFLLRKVINCIVTLLLQAHFWTHVPEGFSQMDCV